MIKFSKNGFPRLMVRCFFSAEYTKYTTIHVVASFPKKSGTRVLTTLISSPASSFDVFPMRRFPFLENDTWKLRTLFEISLWWILRSSMERIVRQSEFMNKIKKVLHFTKILFRIIMHEKIAFNQQINHRKV